MVNINEHCTIWLIGIHVSKTATRIQQSDEDLQAHCLKLMIGKKVLMREEFIKTWIFQTIF